MLTILCLALCKFSAVAKKRVLFLDKISNSPVEYVHVTGVVFADGTLRGISTFSDSTGIVVLNYGPEPEVRLSISRVGFSPKAILDTTIGEIPDTIFLHQSTQIYAASVYADVYRRENGKIIYNVEADTAVQKGNGLDAIGRTPTLFIDGWNILSEKGSVSFLLNGARDYTINMESSDFLREFSAKNIKRIEVSETKLYGGQKGVEVNVVAKNRLIGFMGWTNTEISDNKISNSTTLQGRTGRTTFILNAGVFRNYRSHTVANSGDLDISSDAPMSRFVRTGKSWDAKLKGFRIEPYIIHNVDSKSKAEFYYKGLFFDYGNYQSNSSTIGEIFNAYDVSIARYAVSSATKYNRNNDHDLYVRYRRELGPKGAYGQFNLSYNMYRMNDGNSTAQHYTGVQLGNQAVSSSIHPLLFDYTDSYRHRKTDHILQADFNYRLGANRHMWATLTFERNSYKIDVRRTDIFLYPESLLSAQVNDDYLFRRLKSHLNTFLRYRHMFRPFNVSVGGNLSYRHNRLAYNSTLYADNRIKSSEFKIMPFFDISVPKLKQSTFSYYASQYAPSFEALNPHINNLTPGFLSYGNIDLKPESQHNLSLSSRFSFHSANLTVRLSETFTSNLLGAQRLVKDGLLHTTYGNIGKRNATSLFASANRSWRNFYLNVNGTVEYSDVRSPMLGRSAGFWGKLRGNLSYDLPLDISLYVEGSYATPMKLLCGKSNGYFTYNLSLSRYLDGRGKWEITFDASNFISTHRNRHTDKWGVGYRLNGLTRIYQAAYSVSVSFRFNGYRNVGEPNKELRTDYCKSNYDI